MNQKEYNISNQIPQKKIYALYFLLPLILFTCQPKIAIADFQENPPKLTISVVGDIMVHKPQIKEAYSKKCKCYNFESSFAEIKPIISKADLAIGNLETTLPGKRYSGYPQFGAPDALLDAIKDTGFDILVTANNHSMDKGKSGLIRTIDTIRNRKLLQTGTFRNIKERKNNRVLNHHVNGFHIALLNYTYGTNGLKVPVDVGVNLINKKTIIDDMALARKKNPDVLIVYYHFGQEYKLFPNAYQKKFVDLALMEGADIVLGSHPHNIQPYEIRTLTDKYKKTSDRLIVYSLGNFISAQQNLLTRGGLMLNITLEKLAEKDQFSNIKITNVSDELVFVYRKKEKRKTHYIVKPIASSLQKKEKLEKTQLKKMKLFYKKMNRHLNPFRQKVQKRLRNTENPKK